MSKALVIKGVNFATNKIETVSFSEEVPCTGISLDKSTMTLANIGTTGTLTATALPANTTDEIVWTSSDIRIALVDNGVVTVTGAGTVTITAVCGECSASCEVTTTHTLDFDYLLNAYCSPRDYSATTKPINKIVLGNASADANYGVLYQTDALQHGIYNLDNKYPVYFGKASTLTITAPNNIKVTVQITDSTQSPADMPEYEGEVYTKPYAVWTFADDTPWSSGVSVGNRTVTVPESSDSVVITLRKTTADLSASDIANVTIVAS